MDRPTIDRALSIARQISSIRDLVAGSPEEFRACSYLVSELEDLCDDVEIMEFEVLTWGEDLCLVEIGSRAYRCSACPPTPSIDVESRACILSFSQVLQEASRERVEGRIVFVEGVEDPDDVVDVVDRLSRLGALALVVLDNVGLRRIVVPGTQLPALRVGRLALPVVFVEGRPRGLEEGAKARVVVSTRSRHSFGKNVVCTVGGRDDREIVLAAHYDHWLWGGADNSVSVGIAIEALRKLRDSTRSLLRLVLFSGEEGLPPNLVGMYWAVGSRKYVVERIHELLERSTFLINMDVVYRGNVEASISGFEAMGVAKALNISTNLNIFIYDAQPFAELGIPTITLNTFNEMLREGLYHSVRDTVDIVDPVTVAATASLATRIAKLLDSADMRELFLQGLREAIALHDALRLEARAFIAKVLREGLVEAPWDRTEINRAMFRTLVPPEFLSKPMREQGFVGWWRRGWIELPTAMVLDDDSEISALYLLTDKYCIWSEQS